MLSSYVRYHYHFIWMLITRKPQEDLERQNKTERKGDVWQHFSSKLDLTKDL